MGNINQTSRLSNILHSVPYKSLSGQNTCFAHQEIDPNHYFYTSPDPKAKRIFSTVNCLPYPELYNLYKGLLPEVDFRAYGASCPNGPLNGSKDVSSHMREASLGWHCKPGGGLGHSAMGWMASGRGVITKMSDHRQYGGDATRLFEPGITCLDIEARDVTSNCMQIRKLLDPAVCLKLSENAYKRFREVINYNEEELRVRKFL
ncbi:hypothetical protein LRR18_16445, partial [Mangrovimonas sp. AS39]|uniref:hypothetical protein n=1 Tax=Mangrovimonas futianensis TaxID=2895523 RepID=UPI001E4346EA